MNHYFEHPCPTPCKASQQAARTRQESLTKPSGSLGELENIAVKFAGWQKTEKPTLENTLVRVFAGDHGICAQNVSAFPQEVTMQMVLNFIHGGAAISVLSNQEYADFAVVNMGLANPLPNDKTLISHPKLINISIAAGTRDFSVDTAMDMNQALEAMQAGHDVIHSQVSNSPHLFIGGEMGIGNTSAASAIYCALLNLSTEQSVGPGTGINATELQHKIQIIETSLHSHALNSSDPLSVLCAVGGFEIAALTGAYIAAAQQKIPSLIDGFISTAAALIACKLNPSCRDWLLFSHQSAEPAHILALQHLQAKPLLNIGMRLGEGSGSLVCLPLLKNALALHNNMATFTEAQVAVADKHA